MKEKMKIICELEKFAGLINVTHRRRLRGELTSMEELAYLMKKATSGKNLELTGWKACTLAAAIEKGLTHDAVFESLKSHTKMILNLTE